MYVISLLTRGTYVLQLLLLLKSLVLVRMRLWNLTLERVNFGKQHLFPYYQLFTVSMPMGNV